MVSNMHYPVGGTVDISANGNPTSLSVWADEGATLTFKSATPGAVITAVFSRPIFNGQNTVTGKSPLTSPLITGPDGDYTVTVTVTTPGVPGPQTSPPIATYIRTCKNCQ